MIAEKIKLCLWKLELRFWTYGLIHLLGPSGPNAVFKPQTPRSTNFLKFHNFIGFISQFLKKGSPVCENWSLCSELIIWFIFWTQVAQMQLLGPTVQSQDNFWDSLTLMDSSHDSWVNEALFVEIGVRVLDLWLDMSSGPKCPKWSF